MSKKKQLWIYRKALFWYYTANFFKPIVYPNDYCFCIYFSKYSLQYDLTELYKTEPNPHEFPPSAYWFKILNFKARIKCLKQAIKNCKQ